MAIIFDVVLLIIDFFNQFFKKGDLIMKETNKSAMGLLAARKENLF